MAAETEGVSARASVRAAVVAIFAAVHTLSAARCSCCLGLRAVAAAAGNCRRAVGDEPSVGG